MGFHVAYLEVEDGLGWGTNKVLQSKWNKRRLETGHICSPLRFTQWNILPVYSFLSQNCCCQGKVSAVTVPKHTLYSIFHTLMTGQSAMLNHLPWDELLLMDKMINLALISQSSCTMQLKDGWNELDVVTWKRSTLFVLLHCVLMSGTINTAYLGERGGHVGGGQTRR